MRATAAILLVIPATPACNLLTDFEVQPEAETSERLCGDGRDNDFDGLADCQDWRCLGIRACCDMPEVLVDDDFEQVGACDAPACTGACAGDACPDDTLWHAWPCPYALVCDGALWPGKDQPTSCPSAGVLSRADLPLASGLRIEVGLLGAPEQQGYLEVGLTFRTEADIPGSTDPCGGSEPIDAFAAVRQVHAPEGYRLVARFLAEAIGESAAVADVEAEHVATLEVDEALNLVFRLDGVEFARSAAALPDDRHSARLALVGLTTTARFSFARLEAGQRCHEPAAWTPVPAADDFVALAPGEPQSVWDSHEVWSPAIAVAGGGETELYYTGCNGLPDCDITAFFGIGVARALDGGLFVRDEANPLLGRSEFFAEVGASTGVRDMDLSILEGKSWWGFVSSVDARGGIFPVDQALRPAGPRVAGPRSSGWSQDSVCCASAVARPDGTIGLWFAGRAVEDPTWRIGVAVGREGEALDEPAGNPVLREGPPGAFDEQGVRDPFVLYDETRKLYRMWYTGLDFFGTSAIGYAVSADGVRWSKFPDNPVLLPASFGLEDLGGPVVLRGRDGRLQLWAHGTSAARPARHIYRLENRGTPYAE